MGIGKIFKKYGEKKDISGIKSTKFNRLNILEQIEVIKKAKGRNIIFNEAPKNIDFYETSWKYSGKIDPNFNWDEFWNSIFDFTYEDFLKDIEKNKK